MKTYPSKLFSRIQTFLVLFASVLAMAHSAAGALFTSDASIAVGDTNYEGEDILVMGCTVTIDGPHAFSDLFIFQNGVVTHSPATNSQDVGVDLIISNTVFIDAGSKIEANGLGYAAGNGPGAGTTGSATDTYGLAYTNGGGGAYGGNGGAGVAGQAGGGAYGSILAPDLAGSGGGAGFGPGGAGGGIVHLTIGGELVVDGAITANGSPGTNTGSGGGSGGGIFISAAATSGLGSITANGGAGEPGAGGGGGGGRIGLLVLTNDFSGTITARGGPGVVAGGAGTINLGSPNSSQSDIVVDNGGSSGTNTPLAVSPQNSLSLSGGAVGYFSSSTVNVSSLTVASNSWVMAAPGSATLQLTAGTVSIQTNGGIDLTDAGGLQGAGPGGIAFSNESYLGGGGGHGGLGGNGIRGAGGTSYDNYNEPTELGSGGGRGAGNPPNAHGGFGGGAIKLSVTGMLTLNGVFAVDGDTGKGEGSGGGSGGSVWLSTKGLSGSGLISAKGGNAGSDKGGGGGGGRIFIDATSNTFTGQIMAHGGTGYVGGGAGTICLITNLALGEVVLDNGGMSGTNTPINLTSLNNLTVMHGAKAMMVAELNAQSLLIASNGYLVSGTTTGQLNVSKNAVIELGGAIVADGAGFNQASEGLTVVSNGITTGGGAGNGGYGGGSALGAPGGNAVLNLGNADSFFPGSAGGGGGGAGGGSLHVNVAGSLTLNGTISANGEPGLPPASGGGSGGSIYITAASLAGVGALSANGGAGELPYGGGGGGGGIVISTASNQFTGTVTAYGGNGAVPGGAGLILEEGGPSVSQVLIDNGGLSGAATPFSGLAAFFDLSIVGGAVAVSANGSFVTRGINMVIGSNSFLSSLPGNVANWSFSGNVTIQPTGGLVVDGKGYTGGLGEGAGEFVTGGLGGGGGGYGGNGGAGQGGSPGGNAYGSPGQPSLAGSGGTSAKGAPALGSQGGGALVLTAGGTLFVGGVISANGSNGVAFGAGGGSGGGLFLTAHELAGGGSIIANGGSGQLPSGGGGGGGRIELSAATNEFTGVVSAYGGAGFAPGGAGTILISPGTSAVNELIIDGGGMATGRTLLASSETENIDLIIRGGSVCLLPNIFENVPLQGLFVGANSFLIQRNPDATSFAVTGNVIIQAGGGIILDGAGNETVGPGAGGNSFSSFGFITGGGGGHGGRGGNGEAGASGGASFDTVEEPALRGSIGGNDGAAGGGALNLRVTGSLEVDGVISANGAPATNQAGGGGSGGSIYLSMGTLSGVGMISANGGAGDWPNGGGGGGGRIALNYQSNFFAGEISASGGIGYQTGGAGTIYLNPALPFAPPAGGVSFPREVIVDNGGNGNGAATPLGQISGGIPANQLGEYYDLIVSGGANVNPTASWSLNSLLVETNSFISQATNSVNITVLSNALVQAGAAISADSQGWDGDTGPAPGTTATNDTSSGGGYGGMGGASAGGSAGGETNGAAQTPVGWGSGGGVAFGKMVQLSQGGGAIKLSAGTLTINGSVSANGANGTFPGAGGGAGGSVWLTAGTLAGTGEIAANGGSGQAGVSGGGGGGRIAIYALTNEYSGGVTANGGPGFAPGGNGTIYLTNSSVPVVAQSVAEGALLALAQPQNTSLVTLSWTGVPGVVYQVESSSDFLSWQPLGPLPAGSEGRINLRLSSAAERNRFFRVVPAN